MYVKIERGQLRKSVSTLVDSFASDFQKIVDEEQNEIEELSSTNTEDAFSKYETTKKVLMKN